MPLPVAARLGPYEVLGPLGAGGMGEVYRARDTRLDRIVALKVLPADLAQNPERRSRFEREARAVSALNHPHICTLHDIGHQDGIDYLVLEYIEGETLAERLKRGPLPLEQVLRYGIEIADALDKAHRQGIVHRDLKPGNVMLTKAGAKLLDFGLAKLRPVEPRPVTSVLSELPTVEKPGADPLTGEGRLLGTFQYMAPEQLEGREADARTDIFALGSVLYEMTTGRRAFTGKSTASLVAAILEKDPPSVAALQPMTPPALDRLIRTCLNKDADERWQSAHDIAAELRWVQEAASATARPAQSARLAWSVAACAALCALLAVPITLSLATRLHPSGTSHTVVTSILPPKEATPDYEHGIALSPDRRQLAFAALTRDGERLLWVRSMETGQADSVPDTEDATSPFWSPDSRAIGFFARGKLRKVAPSGGPVQTICPVGVPGRASWGANDVILFHGQQTSTILRVSSAGGAPEEATKLDVAKGDVRHSSPAFLPDGLHFLYALRGRQPGIYLARLHEVRGRLLVPDATDSLVGSGYFLFQRENMTFAQALSPDGSRLGKEAVMLPRRDADRTDAPSAGGSDLVYLPPVVS